MRSRQWVFGFLALWSIGVFAPPAHADGLITLKVIAINPSDEETQRAEIKAFLPKEIQPDDVVEKGDLKISYDSAEGAYFVYGEYDLKPKETLEREIDIKDVWMIPVKELEFLRSEAGQTAALLEHTEFQDRIAFLKTSIETKLDKILSRQQTPSVSPDRHISEYRENLILLESGKSDLLLARSLLAQLKPKAAVLIIWKIFIAIVAFLGLLGVAFFLIWHTQLKTITASTFGTEPTTEPEAAFGQTRQTTESKPIATDDIEKLLRESPSS